MLFSSVTNSPTVLPDCEVRLEMLLRLPIAEVGFALRPRLPAEPGRLLRAICLRARFVRGAEDAADFLPAILY